MAPVKPLFPPNPKTFGRYEVETLIGDGAMGRVYRGFDPLVRRAVAIKTFKTEGLDEATGMDYVRRFRREAQAAGALSHPHIVSIFDVGDDYFVMEFLEGKTLQALIEERRKLEPADALKLFTPIADALDYAHRKGVIHRDIKPGNIMVLPDGRTKLMDFGVARIESSQMTKAGEVLGSPSYMAPEQIAGHEVTSRADLFSVAAVAYQAITGQKPFQGQTVTTVIYKVVHEDPPPPRSWNQELPPRYDEVFRKALAKDPAARFPTARAFVAALDIREFEAVAFDALETRPMPAARPDPGKPPTVPAMPAAGTAERPRSAGALGLWILAAFALASIAVGGLVLFAWSRSPVTAPAATTTAPTSAGLQIETEPPGARVSVDGKEVGITPLTVPSVAPGLRTVRIERDGYAPAALSLDVAQDAVLAPLRFSLTPTEARASIHSDPEGAAVTIDGRDAGRTPLEDVRLSPGMHEVRVEGAGRRPWRQRVEAKAGEPVSVQARLAPLPETKKEAAAEPAPTPTAMPEPEATPPAIKEGDLVELGPGVTSPRRISGNSPAYPRRAAETRLQGTVVVEMIVTEKGEPVDVRIVESAGEVLDRAVLDAAKTWRFEPAQAQGTRVRVRWQVRQEFRVGR
jgi:serine/threonine-protein kinase